MFLRPLKKCLFLTISAISVAQCLAESPATIDYIKAYLPETSWIRASHEQQHEGQASYERLNCVFERLHKAAIYEKSNPESTSRERGLRLVNDNETLKQVALLTVVDALQLSSDTPENKDNEAGEIVKKEMPLLDKAMRSIWKDGAGDDLESNTIA